MEDVVSFSLMLKVEKGVKVL